MRQPDLFRRNPAGPSEPKRYLSTRLNYGVRLWTVMSGGTPEMAETGDHEEAVRQFRKLDRTTPRGQIPVWDAVQGAYFNNSAYDAVIAFRVLQSLREIAESGKLSPALTAFLRGPSSFPESTAHRDMLLGLIQPAVDAALAEEAEDEAAPNVVAFPSRPMPAAATLPDSSMGSLERDIDTMFPHLNDDHKAALVRAISAVATEAVSAA